MKEFSGSRPLSRYSPITLAKGGTAMSGELVSIFECGRNYSCLLVHKQPVDSEHLAMFLPIFSPRASSYASISRLLPTKSAARLAANLLWRRSSATGLSQMPAVVEILFERNERVHRT